MESIIDLVWEVEDNSMEMDPSPFNNLTLSCTNPGSPPGTPPPFPGCWTPWMPCQVPR